MTTTITVGEHAAHWWLPEHEDCRVVGRYVVNADGTTMVELYENLEEKISKKKTDGTTGWPLAGPDEYPVIHGSVNGMLVTAISSQLHGLNHEVFEDIRVELRRPRYTIESHYYHVTQSDLLFKKVRVSPICLTELIEWGMGPDKSANTASDDSESHTVELATQPIQTAITEDARVELHQDVLFDVANHDGTISLSKRGSIVIELEDPVNIRKLNSRFIFPLMYMLTILSGQPEGVSEFEFSPGPASDLEETDLSADTNWPEIWMTVRFPVLMRMKQEERTREPLSLLSLIDWPDAVPRWLDWAELATAEMQLSYLLMAKPYSWLEVRFVTCAQVVEGMHRKTFPVPEDAIRSNEDMTAKVLSILKDSGEFNSIIRGDVKGALKYLYEPSLEKRIVKLDAATGGIISGIDGVDIKIVANKCAELRNAFAHSTERRPVTNMRRVYVAYAILYLLGLTALLAQLETSTADAVAKIRQWSGTKGLVNTVKEHWGVLQEEDAAADF